MNREKTRILSVLVAALILVVTTVSFSAVLDGAEIIVLFPQNLTYATRCGDVPLIFAISEPTSWIGYSLDGQANVTVSGNITLAGLSYGDHCVKVYADDTYGNISSSDTVSFAIILGDVDGDGECSSMDLFYVAAAYGTSKGDYYHYALADLDNDDDVDSMDLFTLAPNYGKIGIVIEVDVSTQSRGPKTPNLLCHIYLNPDLENQDLDIGVLDIIDWPLAKEWIETWTGRSDITTCSYSELGMTAFHINHQRWPTGCGEHEYFDHACSRCLAAREFRKAIAHLTDKDMYVSEILKECGFRLDLPMPSFLTRYSTDLEELGLLYEYNVTRANETLNNAGFQDWDIDGFLEWKHPTTGDVEELPELVFYIRMDEPCLRSAGEVLAAELEAIGLKFEYPDPWKWNFVFHDCHLYTHRSSLAATPDVYYNLYSSYTYFGPETRQDLNYAGFCNHEFDEYAYITRFPDDVEKAKIAAKEAGRVFAENVAAIPLWFRAATKAYRTGWDGVVNNLGYGVDNSWTFLHMDHPTDDTIDYGFKSDIEQLNAVSSERAWDHQALGLTYDSLMGYNPYNLELTEYWLAESHELGVWDNAGADATEMNYSLRPIVTWHDGAPVTLEDVKFTIEFTKACGPVVAWNYLLVQDVNSVDVIEDKIRVRMNHYSMWALEWIGKLPIIKKSLWENIEDLTGRTWTHPDFDFTAVREYDPMVDDLDENGVPDLKQDGTGPWIFDKWKLGTSISFKANTNYCLSQEHVSTRITEMFHQIGDVDYDGCVNIRDIDLILRAFATTSASGGIPGEWGAWNPAADLNKDDSVFLTDLVVAAKNFGKRISC